MNDPVTTLDVRDDLLQGRPPFERIMAAVEALGPGEAFRIIAPFEPTPLYAALGRKGLTHTSARTEGGDWEVLFARNQPGEVAVGCVREVELPSQSGGAQEVEVDARGLEPPEPMVRILEAVATLPPGGSLRARTDRRPLHLLGELTARGFNHCAEEQADGSFVTHIGQA